jgi:DHA1 family bicyclomycin/chloramphenicol resistance-like MFS transporter
MVQDFFPVQERARVFSLLMLVLSASPLLAPSIGGLVVTWWSWRIIFAILTVIGALNFAMVYWLLPEGHAPPDTEVSLRIPAILQSFKRVLKVPDFYVYALAGSFSFAGLFVYITGSASIFMDEFHVSSAVYAGIFAFLVTGMLGGGQLNLIFTKRLISQTIFKTALILQVIVAAIFFAGSIGGGFGFWSTILILFILLACTGMTGPNANSLALAPFSGIAGVASSLLGFIQLALGSIISAAVGLMDFRGALPTAATMSISSLIGLIILLTLGRSLAAQSN